MMAGNTFRLAGRALAALGCLAAAAGAATMLAAASPPPILPPQAATVEAGHLPFGPVLPPRALPDVRLTLDDGAETSLKTLAAGRFTLLQLMFSGCSTTCPIQGAIFERAQGLLAAEGREARLLSISVDVVGDRPAALKTWLAGFRAGAGWRAAVPAADALGPLVDALHGRGEGVDVHDARVYVIDPDGRLVFATEDMPNPAGLLDLLREAEAARDRTKV